MVSTYTVLLAVHLLAAVVWVGSNVALDLQAARALATDDPARTSGFLSDAAFLGGRVFAPAAGILLLAGFGLMVEVDYDFDFWIIFALAVWLIVEAAGALRRGDRREYDEAGSPLGDETDVTTR